MNTYTCLGGPLHGQEISQPTASFRIQDFTGARCVFHGAAPPPPKTVDVFEYRLQHGFWMINPAHREIGNRFRWTLEQFLTHHRNWPRAVEMGWLDFLDACSARGSDLDVLTPAPRYHGFPLIVRDDLQYHLKVV